MRIPIKLLLLLSLFVLLNVLDILTTHILLQLGAVEANPWFGHFNERGIGIIDICIKAAITLGYSALIYFLYLKAAEQKSKLSMRFAYGLMILLDVFYVGVLINNAYCIFWALSSI